MDNNIAVETSPSREKSISGAVSGLERSREVGSLWSKCQSGKPYRHARTQPVDVDVNFEIHDYSLYY